MWCPIVCDEDMTQGEYAVCAAGMFAHVPRRRSVGLGKTGFAVGDG